MANSSSLSMKLLIDTQAQRVLFAEVDKDCVDFLFHILSLPIATIFDILLGPANIPDQGYGSSYPLLLLNHDASAEKKKKKKKKKKMYRCVTPCALTVSNDPGSVCPKCSGKMTCSMSYMEQEYSAVTYMVMDNLLVKPMSTFSSITMLNKQFDVKDVGKLEEKVVDFGVQEAVNLLKASLQSDKVLTNVFLKGKAAAEETNGS